MVTYRTTPIQSLNFRHMHLSKLDRFRQLSWRKETPFGYSCCYNQRVPSTLIDSCLLVYIYIITAFDIRNHKLANIPAVKGKLRIMLAFYTR